MPSEPTIELTTVWKKFDYSWSQGSFELQRCEDCKSLWFYPNVICHNCYSSKFRWTQIARSGIVYSFTWIPPQSPPRGSIPELGCVLVDLDEGIRLLGLIDMGDHTRSELKIGSRLKIVSLDAPHGPIHFVFDGASSDC